MAIIVYNDETGEVKSGQTFAPKGFEHYLIKLDVVTKVALSQAEQVFRRMVFNVIARNCDDHTKTFAFLLKQESEWEISPAYDICHRRPMAIIFFSRSIRVFGRRCTIGRSEGAIRGGGKDLLLFFP